MTWFSGVAAIALFMAMSPSASVSPIDELQQTPCNEITKLKTDAGSDVPEAQLRLATLYFTGRCVTENHNEGTAWVTRAAKLGHPRAQKLLGLMYYNAKNFEEAAQWIKPVASNGDATAQMMLADMLKNGSGLPKDEAEAAVWAKRGAEQGNPGAQALLASLLISSSGVDRNYVEADKWLILAERSDPENADLGAARTAVEPNMSKNEIAEAQRRANEWKAKPERGGK